ncbi:uncharacterized protein F5891DRAFT_1196838 [Suillus fuscotomentosus]|uniref:Uncharacterized protein n=1 Tax=Suillus fuscotomentosus TaxID=1912939 RepID=A0AAD4DSQ2_9AGAM|nr:uncharacterized protein F5891DRAFT_1196838 [Suillus fuscotomentosus]KAG1893116.1 hypothetical protein F5891DRAFT_1196838 [Suillus fuscotomentosus]
MSESQNTPRTTSTLPSWITDMMAQIHPDRRSEYSIDGTGDDVSVWWDPPSSSTRTDPYHCPPSMFSSRSSTPHSQHSHDFEPCFGGQAHGQGGPVYSCGCYRRTNRRKVEDTDAPEQHQGLGIRQEVDSSKENRSLPVKRERSESSLESDPLVTTPRFGRNLTNVQRAKSAPAFEAPKPRKLAKVFEFNRSATHDTLIMNVVKRLEAAVDRQTEVLSKIYGVLESSAKLALFSNPTKNSITFSVLLHSHKAHSLLLHPPVAFVLAQAVTLAPAATLLSVLLHTTFPPTNAYQPLAIMSKPPISSAQLPVTSKLSWAQIAKPQEKPIAASPPAPSFLHTPIPPAVNGDAGSASEGWEDPTTVQPSEWAEQQPFPQQAMQPLSPPAPVQQQEHQQSTPTPASSVATSIATSPSQPVFPPPVQPVLPPSQTTQFVPTQPSAPIPQVPQHALAPYGQPHAVFG